MNFSCALEQLKGGKRISRTDWNGKDMWLRYYNPHCDKEMPIGMKTADNGFVPWLASQTDILADDWVIAW